jgi:hypothetical protein
MRSFVWFSSMVVCLALAGLLAADPGSKATEEKRGEEKRAEEKRAGDKKPAEKDASKKAAKTRSPISVTPEREAAVRTFVERNHPELSGLLAHLKEHQPKEYERAVRELHRVTERLAGVRERDSAQYDLEIKLWTAQSQVQLLAARLKMGQSEELKDQLRQALGAQADAKVDLLKHEKSRVAGRLSKIERDLAHFEGERQQVIEKQLEVLARGANPQRVTKSNNKAAKRPAKPSAE